ncbi:monocarboxylate transporter 2-like [Palaemon carinicauda]|uniref:monocarboxylate transporter 2-like n=1 Tax=Palaemon carinicauda TaxID=392227 RepID=UPI0035B60126
MGGKPSKKLVPNRPLPKPLVPVVRRTTPKRQVKMIPPDGGWGWMVVLGACLTFFFFPAVTVAFGVMFRDRLLEMGANSTSFTLIGNALSTVWSFTALIAAPLSELFGHRNVTITGGLLAFLAMILSAFSTSLISFGLSYAVIGGMAGCLSTFNGYTIIPLYFSRRKGLANGLVSSASALGKIAMAPLVQLLLDTYGYKWACLVIGALSLHSCVSGMLFQPPTWHQIPEEEESDCEIIDMDETRSSTSRDESHNDRLRSRSIREDDENVIFAAPTALPPAAPAQKQREDDEVILFTRDQGRESIQAKRKAERQHSLESTLSWTGSLDMMPPVNNKVFDDDDEDSGDRSCCDDFVVVKVFRMLNYSMLKDPKFHLVAWPNALCIMGYLNSMYALPGYITSLHYSDIMAAFAISVFSATEVVCRIAFAVLSDYHWFPVEKGYVTGITLSAISMSALTLVPSYKWILFWVSMNGIALSLTSVLLIHLMIKYLGQENYAQVIGFCSILNGILLIVGGFLVGAAHDYFASYECVFYILTLFIGCGAVIWAAFGTYEFTKSRARSVSIQATT